MPDKYRHPENFEKAQRDLRSWRDANDAKKAATSAEGKAHTKAKNSISFFLREEGLPASTAVVLDDGVYTYGVSTSERIKPREWHRLWQEGEITEDQYFAALSVTKDEAKNAIGSDQVETISQSIAGKEAKVRFEERTPEAGRATVEQAKPKNNRAARPNVKPVKPLQTPANPKLRVLTLKHTVKI